MKRKNRSFILYLQESIPFAVVGANKEHQVNGNKVLGRKTKWGIIEGKVSMSCLCLGFSSDSGLGKWVNFYSPKEKLNPYIWFGCLVLCVLDVSLFPFTSKMDVWMVANCFFHLSSCLTMRCTNNISELQLQFSFFLPRFCKLSKTTESAQCEPDLTVRLLSDYNPVPKKLITRSGFPITKSKC